MADDNGKHKRKKVLATNTKRRIEIDDLQQQKERLEGQLAWLEAQSDSRDDRHMPSLDQMLTDTTQLQYNCHYSDLFLEGARSIFSQYASLQHHNPFKTSYIHLTKDPTERRRTLRSIKASRLAYARDFLAKRCHVPHVNRDYSEDNRFETTQKEFLASRTGVMFVQANQPPYEVHIGLKQLLFNIEVNMSDTLGSMTFREDADSDDPDIVQNRLVTSTKYGITFESNSVIFSEFRPVDHPNFTGEYGLITNDYVDEDDLHPFQGEDRARKDVSVIFKLSSQSERTGGTGRKEMAVTWWANIKVHRPKFDVGSQTWVSITESIDAWLDSLHHEMRNALRPASIPTTQAT